EHDGLGRAHRLAGGDYLAVANLPVVTLGVDPRLIDALHAIGALLHHAAAAHGDIRIPRRVVALRVPVLIEQEVEAADLVGAVVRAVARAHAAVVGHVVQTFRAVGRRGHRADQLARRILALHARH